MHPTRGYVIALAAGVCVLSAWVVTRSDGDPLQGGHPHSVAPRPAAAPTLAGTSGRAGDALALEEASAKIEEMLVRQAELEARVAVLEERSTAIEDVRRLMASAVDLLSASMALAAPPTEHGTDYAAQAREQRTVPRTSFRGWADLAAALNIDDEVQGDLREVYEQTARELDQLRTTPDGDGHTWRDVVFEPIDLADEDMWQAYRHRARRYLEYSRRVVPGPAYTYGDWESEILARGVLRFRQMLSPAQRAIWDKQEGRRGFESLARSLFPFR